MSNKNCLNWSTYVRVLLHWFVSTTRLWRMKMEIRWLISNNRPFPKDMFLTSLKKSFVQPRRNFTGKFLLVLNNISIDCIFPRDNLLHWNQQSTYSKFLHRKEKPITQVVKPAPVSNKILNLTRNSLKLRMNQRGKWWKRSKLVKCQSRFKSAAVNLR